MAKKLKSIKNKPTAAFILILIGGTFVFFNGLVISLIGAAMSIMLVSSLIGGSIGLIGIISGLMMILAAIMINMSNKTKATTWSIVALIFSVISLLNMGGFIIGFILGFIGSILGLTHNK